MKPTLIPCIVLLAASRLAAAEFASHPPMRPLPQASARPLPDSPCKYVDTAKGDDGRDGTEAKPWRTLAFAVKQLQPGDTLVLRGGTYYEAVAISAKGTAEKPITLRAHPGELAIVDAGLREFYESPATAWEPVAEGAPGEFRSTRSYPAGGRCGNFGDSMAPFHQYLTMADLRSTNELWRKELADRAEDPAGIYCGPGVRRDKETGRIHIRLAHTQLAGLGASAYRGETDPRKLPLVVTGHDHALQIRNARHLRVQDIVVRGAGRAALHIEDSEDIALDGVTLYAGQMALRTSRVNKLRAVDSAFRGHGAPWHSRFSHKNRANAGYLIAPGGGDLEFVRCEFTDHHDFIALGRVDGARIHRCHIDNFNDDGIELGPKRERGQFFIHENLISRCLSPFTAHAKKPTPVTAAPGSGAYIFRNLVDLRRGTYKSPSAQPDPSGAFLDEPTEIIAHDHGSPVHAVAHVYHNTFLMARGPMRGAYAFSWGAHTRGTTRRVFNNVFLQLTGLKELNFTAVASGDDFQTDGNLYWSVKDGPGRAGDFFGKLRASPLLAASRAAYAPGWSASDRFADPRFVALDADGKHPLDARLRDDSPALGAGIALPAEWPDPLRTQGRPDIGALPRGAAPWGVGVNGRVAVSGEGAKP